VSQNSPWAINPKAHSNNMVNVSNVPSTRRFIIGGLAENPYPCAARPIKSISPKICTQKASIKCSDLKHGRNDPVEVRLDPLLRL